MMRNRLALASSIQTALLFRAAAVYGLVTLTGSLVTLGTDPTLRMTQVGFVLVAGIFQILFWIIASVPYRYRPLMLLAVLEIAVPAILLVSFFQTARGSAETIALVAIDLVFGAGILRCWFSTGNLADSRSNNDIAALQELRRIPQRFRSEIVRLYCM